MLKVKTGAVEDLDAAARRYLTALCAELAGRGVRSEVIVSGVRPRLRVSSEAMHAGSADAAFEDNVVAARCSAGTWWFWWPWAEKLAPAGDVVRAAGVIAPRGGGALACAAVRGVC
jgi:hypothetical protein